MYFTRLPNHDDPDFDEAAHFSKFQQQNIVFNALSDKSHCDHHTGCLSIKTVYGGEEWYGVGNRQLVIRPGQLLIFNNDQEYSCRIDTSGEVRVQSVFFKKAFAAVVFQDALATEENLLDNPFNTPAIAPEFLQSLDRIDASLEKNLQGLMHVLNENGYNADMVDERLLFLLQHLILVHKTEKCRAGRIGAVKQATKKEIFRRLCIAADFIQSNFLDKPDLAAISKAACLSIPQLIRQFKTAFHATPHQYLVRVKLAHAVSLLQHTSATVQEITWSCGFDDTSAFCRVFKSNYGVSPLVYRAG